MFHQTQPDDEHDEVSNCGSNEPSDVAGEELVEEVKHDSADENDPECIGEFGFLFAC